MSDMDEFIRKQKEAAALGFKKRTEGDTPIGSDGKGGLNIGRLPHRLPPIRPLTFIIPDDEDISDLDDYDDLFELADTNPYHVPSGEHGGEFTFKAGGITAASGNDEELGPEDPDYVDIHRLVREDFPKLNNLHIVNNGKEDGHFNCIGEAVGDAARWWWPSKFKDGSTFWPKGVRRQFDVKSFDDLFLRKLQGKELHDFKDIDKIEPGQVKMCLFGTTMFDEGRAITQPTHMVRQGADGRWYSKNGGTHEIAVDDPRELEDGIYGDIVRIYSVSVKRWSTLRKMK